MSRAIPLADLPVVSFRAMQKSSLVLFDIACLYSPLHVPMPGSFFDHYAVLAWVEAQIYSVEIALEDSSFDPASYSSAWDRTRSYILELLSAERLNDPPIEAYLDGIGAYFDLVCQRRMRGSLSHDEIVQAAEARPSDLRLLHAILLRQLHQPHEEALFHLVWPLEVLWELQANLAEKKDDLLTKHFNPCLLFTELYGPEAQRVISAEQSRLSAMFEQRKTEVPASLQHRVQAFIDRYRQAYPLQSRLLE